MSPVEICQKFLTVLPDKVNILQTGSRLMQGGCDLFALKKLGRWKSLDMVLRYAHHNPESLRNSVNILDNVRESSTKKTQLVSSEM